ncbi:hypothetical protein [Sapientia aquatica]|uniref:Uncharacterized protein n=1 Tax=Sapientia aquatica TaxID=1549640 RepID=A0A4V3AUV2_9BURK|nr:hypothetical protein [Sapientia aquatica]TDK66460.1 hypothetical protein E2I14_08295 [Sapientia aquatica]
MKTLIGNIASLSLVTINLLGITSAYAQENMQLEIGRLQVCNPADTTKNVIEIPVDGKYRIAGVKVGLTEPLVITPIEFSQNPPRSTSGNRFKLENRDGKLVAQLNFNGVSCIYLAAQAPVLKNNITLSGTHVSPSWNSEADGTNVDGISYRYFNSIDQTYYVASEIGKTLTFAAHDSQTGSNLNSDHINKIDVSNPKIVGLMASAFQSNLERRNQYDSAVIDLEKLNINVNELDVSSSSDVTTLIGKLKEALQPPAHSRLLLALPKKGKVQLKFSNQALIGNRLAGQGFYRDSNVVATGDTGPETIVPMTAFINFQAALIDFDSGKLITSQAYADGRLFFSSQFPIVDITDAIVDKQKIVALNTAVNVGVASVMKGIFESK